MTEQYGAFANQIDQTTAKRLQRMNADINRVNNDLRMLDRLANKDQSLKLGRFADLQLIHSKSSNILDRGGYGRISNYAEGEQDMLLPRLRLRNEYDVGYGNPTKPTKPTKPTSVMLANFISSGGKMPRDKREASPTQYAQASYWDPHSKSNNRINFHDNLSGDQDNDHDYFYSKANRSSIATNNDGSKKQILSQERHGISPFESAKILTQKLSSKDAALTNSIILQQKNQHKFNKSIRVSHQTAGTIDKNSTGYKIDDLQKNGNFKVLPQTASTGVFSFEGHSNKIDPPGKEHFLSPYYPQSEVMTRSNFPSVLRPVYAIKDKSRKQSDLVSNQSKPDLLNEDQNISKSRHLPQGRAMVQKYSHLPSPIKFKSPGREVVKSTGIKLDWMIPASEKIDMKSEFKLDKVLGKGNSSTVYRY
jgi:hypothetical protein